MSLWLRSCCIQLTSDRIGVTVHLTSSALRGHRVPWQPARRCWSNIDRRSHGISSLTTFVVSVHDYERLLGTVAPT